MGDNPYFEDNDVADAERKKRGRHMIGSLAEDSGAQPAGEKDARITELEQQRDEARQHLTDCESETARLRAALEKRVKCGHCHGEGKAYPSFDNVAVWFDPDRPNPSKVVCPVCKGTKRDPEIDAALQPPDAGTPATSPGCRECGSDVVSFGVCYECAHKGDAGKGQAGRLADLFPDDLDPTPPEEPILDEAGLLAVADECGGGKGQAEEQPAVHLTPAAYERMRDERDAAIARAEKAEAKLERAEHDRDDFIRRYNEEYGSACMLTGARRRLGIADDADLVAHIEQLSTALAARTRELEEANRKLQDAMKGFLQNPRAREQEQDLRDTKAALDAERAQNAPLTLALDERRLACTALERDLADERAKVRGLEDELRRATRDRDDFIRRYNEEHAQSCKWATELVQAAEALGIPAGDNIVAPIADLRAKLATAKTALERIDDRCDPCLLGGCPPHCIVSCPDAMCITCITTEALAQLRAPARAPQDTAPETPESKRGGT